MSMTGEQLANAILGSVDFAENLAFVLKYDTEQKTTKEILDEINTFISHIALGYSKDLDGYLSKDFAKVKDNIEADLETELEAQANWLRDQSLASVLGFPAQATMHGLYSKYSAIYSGLLPYQNVSFGIKERMLENKALRYWNKTLYPNQPTPEEALRLVRWGFSSRAEWDINKEGSEGITDKIADQLFATFYKQPTESEAFRLWKLGDISEPLYDEILKRHGWDPAFIDTFTDGQYYTPNMRDLIRLADYVPMDDIFIADILRKNGYREEDIPRMVSYIKIRPLRSERTGMAGRYLYDFANGRITEDDLEKSLDATGFLPVEVDMYKTWGELQYNDVILEIRIDQIYYKSQKKQYTTAEEISSDLHLLVQDEVWCNETGWKWYWQNVYKAPA